MANLRTPLCDLLGIEYPIVLAGMASSPQQSLAATPTELVAAVSNAGGLGVMGYDVGLKKYTSAWIDSMTTSIGFAEGSVDASGKVFKFERNDFNPMYGQRAKGRDVITIKDNDHHEIEFFTTPPGGTEFKSGSITSSASPNVGRKDTKARA